MESLIFSTMAGQYQGGCGVDFVFLLKLKAFHERNAVFCFKKTQQL